MFHLLTLPFRIVFGLFFGLLALPVALLFLPVAIVGAVLFLPFLLLRVVLKASGRAAHSSFPELGESAIDKLLDVLIALRSVDWPVDPLLGRVVGQRDVLRSLLQHIARQGFDQRRALGLQVCTKRRE